MNDEEKIKEILDNICITRGINLRGKRKYHYSPVKNTSKQDCYKALYEINQIIGRWKWL